MPVNTSKSTGSAVQNVKQARACFNFADWSADYFDVADNGRLVCRLPGRIKNEISLADLVQTAAGHNLQLPLLIRFPDILTDRVQRICQAFDNAFARFDYQASHTIAYPIKVNQQRCVVEQITQALPDRVGLEAGSKPELMAVLAQSFNKTRHEDLGTIVCNGYKDREYIRLALIGGLLGKRIFIVIEQPDELELVLEQAQELKVKPLLGVRVRLTSIAKGRWQNSGGEKSKFGLSATQLLALLEKLKQRQQTDALKLLHFHIGSQIADLGSIKAAIFEASRYYQELHRLGVPIETLDVGGGLSIDYEGSHSTQMFSANYSVEDYAGAIVSCLVEQCLHHQIPQPEIITECGRALTAHHAVLITEVLDIERNSNVANGEITHPITAEIKRLIKLVQTITLPKQAAAILQQCDKTTQTIHEQYLQDKLSLAERAGLDALIMRVQLCLQDMVNGMQHMETIRPVINERLADKYFCNFSVFQSTPDVWGIEQVFPVVPLTRLDEPLTRHAVVHDLTCDSDGQINSYPVRKGLSATLPVHELIEKEPYYLGIFLVGAYQEILGDMHNLFGDTHSVNVVLNEHGDFQLQDAEPGDRIDQLLEYVHYDSKRLLAQYRAKLDRSKLSAADKDKYYQELADGLSGYTYLEE
ncbi:MAG: biosynthetic arginine decarboxylase [Gammaproteobacteria bacterium]|nr:biosynthetic arginine decarboxylase [Gammaproteobacteria bacterium]